MAWTDLADLHGISPDIELPVHGQVVTFPGRISAWAGSLLLTIRAATLGQEGDAQEIGERVIEKLNISERDVIALESELLGDGDARLAALGVTGMERQHIVNTLTMWHMSGQEAARSVWEAGGKDPARPNRATRRKTGGSSSTKGGKGAAHSREGSGVKSANVPVASRSRSGTRTTRKS